VSLPDYLSTSSPQQLYLLTYATPVTTPALSSPPVTSVSVVRDLAGYAHLSVVAVTEPARLALRIVNLGFFTAGFAMERVISGKHALRVRECH
jgi:hypothetical protein